jgi:hypothetical protein
MGIGLEYMERLFKQRERLKAQRKRIESLEPERVERMRRRGWKIVTPQKETTAISTLSTLRQEKNSKCDYRRAYWSAKWDRRRAKWDARTRKYHIKEL